MGLDVRVYTNIRIAKDEENYDFQAYVIDKEWRHKIKNLEYDAYYNGDATFRGVSYAYSSHSRFREALIKLISRNDLLDSDGEIKWDILPNDVPFYDFINFADNEGCLDWEVSGKIYLDFEKYKDKANATMTEPQYEIYHLWLSTFKHASENSGVVEFS